MCTYVPAYSHLRKCDYTVPSCNVALVNKELYICIYTSGIGGHVFALTAKTTLTYTVSKKKRCH